MTIDVRVGGPPPPGENDDSSVDRGLGRRAGAPRVAFDERVGARKTPGIHEG